MTPKRIRLSRRKGWRMPDNAVKVDRTTKWGNPFIVGVHGTRERCVDLYRLLIGRGALCISLGRESVEEQERTLEVVRRDGKAMLAGADLACWCPLDAPCHADALLAYVNGQTVEAPPLQSLAPGVELESTENRP